MYKEWGPICWIFLHTIIEKLKEDEFKKKRELLIEIITSICVNLPCPNCQKHASNYLNTYKINKCISKNDFRTYMFTFHNMVNKRLNKSLYKIEYLEKYKRCKFPDLLIRFNLVFKKQYHFTKTMDGWKRIKISNAIMEKIKTNQKYFNP